MCADPPFKVASRAIESNSKDAFKRFPIQLKLFLQETSMKFRVKHLQSISPLPWLQRLIDDSFGLSFKLYPRDFLILDTSV